MNDALLGSPPDLLYGLDAIADFVGLTVPQVKHQINVSRWPTFKQGRTVCARRSTLARHFAEQERAAAAARPAPVTAAPTELIGYPKIAHYLGLSEDALRELVDRREVPAYFTDGRLRASRAALDAYLAAREGRRCR